MVHSRSRSGEGRPNIVRVFDLPPRSPSGTATVRRVASTPLPARSEGRPDRGESSAAVNFPRADRAGNVASRNVASGVREPEYARTSEPRTPQRRGLEHCSTHSRGSEWSSASSRDRRRDGRDARSHNSSPARRRAEREGEEVHIPPQGIGRVYGGVGDLTQLEIGSTCSRRDQEVDILLSETDRLMEDLDREYKKKKDKLKRRLADNLAHLKEDRTQTQEEEKVRPWNQEPRHREQEPQASGDCDVRERTRVRKHEFDVSPERHNRRKSPASGAIGQLAEAIAQLSMRKQSRIELPEFYGNPMEWSQFKTAFEEVTNTYKLSRNEQLIKLRHCLRGEARETAMPLLNASKDPDAVMKLLERCFGRPEDIVYRSLEGLRKLPHVGKTARDLNNFAIKVETAVAVLGNIRKEYLYNPNLLGEVVGKLDAHQRARWYEFAEDQLRFRHEPEIVLLSEYLQREADRALRFEHGNTASVTIKKEPERTARGKLKKAVFNTDFETADQELRQKCTVCQQHHALKRCYKFRNMNNFEKWKIVKEARLCYKCLEATHRYSVCRQADCNINGCQRPHHRLLHGGARRDALTRNINNNETTANTVTNNEQQAVAAAAGGCDNILLKMCAVTLRGPKGEAQIYALFDEGSTVTLLDEQIAEKIGARGRQTPLTMKGLNTTWREEGSRAVKVEVRGESGTAYPLLARTVRGIDLKTQSIPQGLRNLNHLKNLDQRIWLNNVRPLLLIGSDNWQLIVTRSLRAGKRNQPAASKTQLGWVIHGAVPSRMITRAHNVLHITVAQERDNKLEKLVKQHFEIDAIGINSHNPIRREDQKAVDIFNKTVRRGEEGHFEVGLPWKEDRAVLPSSRAMAEKRFRSLEKKLSKLPEMKSAYTNQVHRLIENKYAMKSEEGDEKNPNTWYLPHFAVNNKPGKMRLVFDAAAKVNNRSLNDYLLDGPDLLRSLVTILYRFREEKIAVTADIKDMFLRIKIRKQDQPAQLFIWRDDVTHPMTVYKMTSMIFGARSSPFLAHSVRNKNASDFAATHPRALTAITEAHYMDDFVNSYASEEEAKKTIEEVEFVHRQAQFHIREWNSNKPAILNKIPAEHRAQSTLRSITKDDVYEKTLGLLWDSNGDVLQFNTTMRKLNSAVKMFARPPTKREALSAVMSLYDPLGLLSCYTITAKILLQSLWKLNVGWDERVPSQVAAPFEQWLRDLQHISKLKIPRRYHGGSRASRRELHIFCDASEQAYAAAAYWRVERADGSVDTVLVSAKAKVAPVRALTVPRLELQAALIGARLAKHIKDEHRYIVNNIYYWTDSQVVLHWIQNGSRKYTPYVANRLGEIAELTAVDEWRWLPTHQNVADVATRAGYVPREHTEVWFTGPEFLTCSQSGWPAGTITHEEPVDREIVAYASRETTDSSLPKVERFSRYEKLLRATACLFLFADRCRDRQRQLDIEHLRKAEYAWWRKVQTDKFATELEDIRKGNKIRGSSPLYRLGPVEDGGLLRLRGRINAAQVSPSIKAPVILDGRHPFVRLLIDHEHRRAGHIGRERIVNDLRQKFWILRLRPAVREVINRCSLCRLRRARPRQPPTGDLPQERLQPFQRPFSNCGLDYFGPIVVTIGRRHEKRWCALFTCLTTRAIHLEVVASLSADSAIMAMRRMAARRGWPAIMFSDNATNFRGADVELRRAYDEWEPALRDLGLQHRMKWKFIPPGAPNQGGAWERLVRSVKSALAVTLNQKYPREEVLTTLLAEAEFTINARPLTHVSVNHEDEETLTPNHFLLGSSTGLPYMGPCGQADRRAWRTTQGLADEFWRRWVREYLPDLVPRRDATRPDARLAAGDLVVVVDYNMPRNTWPRGIVEQIYPGPDGHVRSADVRTTSGVFRRPITKLAVLATTTERGTQSILEGGGADNEDRATSHYDDNCPR